MSTIVVTRAVCDKEDIFGVMATVRHTVKPTVMPDRPLPNAVSVLPPTFSGGEYLWRGCADGLLRR